MNGLKRLQILVVTLTLLPLMVGAVAGAQDNDPLGGATEFAHANELTKVTVMLDWTPNTNHLGLYVAQAQGYFQEANLEVEIQPAGDVAVDQVVATGAAEFGISYQESFTYSRAAGLPIISVAAIIQHNTSGFASLHDKKPLTAPSDLIGLRYGGFGSPIEQPMLEALIACGSKPGSVEMIDIGFVEPFPLMERDQIDVVWLFRGWDGIRADLQGLKVDYLMLRDYAPCVPDYYTPILITSETLISDKPDVVKAFVQAVARGYAFAIKNPAEASAILLEAAPELDPDLVLKSSEYLAGEFQSDAVRWGQQQPEIWEAFTAFMVKVGAIEGDVDTSGAFSNEFLPGTGE